MRTLMITNKQEIESIIAQSRVCFVGMIDNEGFPYVIPMNFGYADGTIILHSGHEGRHLDFLSINNNVCITFCTEGELRYQHPDVACSYSMSSKSVLCKGSVVFVEDISEKTSLLNIFMANYTDRQFSYSAPALKNVKVWKVIVDQMTAKAFGQNFK